MQIGRYRVLAHVTGSDEGGWEGHVNRIWEEDGELHDVPHTFEKVFPTAEQAMRHAYEQSQVRVDEGVW